MKEQFIDSFLIGFSVGIIIYSIYNNTFGFYVCIPFVLIFLAIRAKNKKKNKTDK